MYGVLNDPTPASEFRLDGARLVLNPGTDGTYRSEHDAFTVIVPKVHWALINRIVGWEIRRNGVTRTYGSSANTGFCQEGVEYATADCTEPVRWYLTESKTHTATRSTSSTRVFTATRPSRSRRDRRRVLTARTTRLLNERFATDIPTIPQPRAGATNNKSARNVRAARIDDNVTPADLAIPRTNTDFDFVNTFERDFIGSDTNKLLPTKLSYNGGTHTINLTYADRPDMRSERRDGMERTLLKRVSRIDVKAIRDGIEHLAYRYLLDYQTAAVDGRSPAVGDSPGIRGRDDWRDRCRRYCSRASSTQITRSAN